ncbi:hypothetical protein HPC38_07150 [Pasteurellaceae bacterium HPA106]|uniref:YgjV family protein n=2 Tax=Spirabiliibacterium TaxID=2820724 RepID=UPI001AAC72A2|nr:YgjV family protein [Spirabiliibacterium pneumoniae]MBE2896650.1 hypothetical protein [Spirabiliibacterium pneumoniae]
MDINFIEILGYIATAFVAGSFLLSKMMALRVVNSIGAILYIIYGALIGSVPVMLLNLFVTAVNFYQIYKLTQRKA